MGRRSDTVGKLEREIQTLRSAIADAESELARQAQLAHEAELEQRRAADDPATFAEAARRERVHGDEHKRLGFVLESRREGLAVLEHRLEDAGYADALEGLRSAAARVRGTSERLAKELEGGVAAQTALDAARDEYTSALARACELRPEHVDLSPQEALGGEGDEAPFPAGVDRLLGALNAGPERPHAKAAVAADKQKHEYEQSQSTLLSQGVSDVFMQGDFTKVRLLRREHLPEALTQLERMHAEEGPVMIEAGWAAGGRRRSDVVAANLERRLSRMRELVGDVEVAA